MPSCLAPTCDCSDHRSERSGRGTLVLLKSEGGVSGLRGPTLQGVPGFGELLVCSLDGRVNLRRAAPCTMVISAPVAAPFN